MHILAIDVGTSSVKAAILDTQTGKPANSIAKANYPLDHPSPDAAEIPADRIWKAAVEVGGKAVAATNKPVEGIGLSTLTPALVLLDKNDRPLVPVWIHLDRRSRPTARKVWDEAGPEFLACIGNRPLPGGMSVISYRQQLEENQSLAKEVVSYLHLNSWLAYRMTGEKAFDPGNASFTGLFATMTDQNWSPRWCEYFEVNPEWLPPVVCGSTTVGELRTEMAELLGIPAGIPVKLGVADTSSAILSIDLQTEDLLHVVGTTQVLAIKVENPTPDPKLLTRLNGIGKEYIQVAHNPVGGVALEWIKNLCFQDQSPEQFFQETIPLAQQKKTSVVFDPPFLGGDRLQIEAHHASFGGLSVTTDRMDLLSALLQAMIERHGEALTNLGRDDALERVYVTGGGAEVVGQLFPHYETADVKVFQEGSLLGIAKLFTRTTRD